MGIESTRQIPKTEAIDRISEIATLVLMKDYRSIEAITNEHEYDLEDFVDRGLNFSLGGIFRWTDKMIEEKIDEPFFRYSMFDNYLLDA